jgi:hypothetical protein
MVKTCNTCALKNSLAGKTLTPDACRVDVPSDC